MPPTEKTNFLPLLIVVLVTTVLVAAIYYLESTFPEFLPMNIPYVSKPAPSVSPEPVPDSSPAAVASYFKKFESEADFKKYLENSEGLTRMGFSGLGERDLMIAEEMGVSVPAVSDGSKGAQSAPLPIADRVSETNVQVLGIDEPDIVKTNGREIFYSEAAKYYYRGFGNLGTEIDIAPSRIMPPYPTDQNDGITKIISAFPPSSLALASEIKNGGDIFLSGNILAILKNDKISGFDVADAKKPAEKWKIDLSEKDSIVSSRLYGGKLYVVLAERIDQYRPCPIMPISIDGKALEIRCADIYHPVQPVAADVTYTVLRIDPATGIAEKTLSFVGDSGSSVLYMSSKNLYVAYSYYPDYFKIISGFFTEGLKDFLPTELVSKIKKLEGYDLSMNTKMTELMVLFENYAHGLSDDEELKLSNEVENLAAAYFKKHMREMEKTGITRVSIDDLRVASAGDVPGRLLNQFSLDEHDGYLRAAVTVSASRGFWWGWNMAAESVNDVYVLDKNLATVGAVKDLGLTERIYSARFIGERGYLVTFRQIDPFYVLDLSDPKNPQMKGELKIPGYSSYLHPIEGDKVLGVGQEGNKVKISLFDATDAQNPKEASKYILNEYWTEVSNNHHAFLMDKKHKVFFLPGGQGGYIFSYENDSLTLKKAVSGFSAKRALYLDDFMYILSADRIVVLDENTWERVKELKF